MPGRKSRLGFLGSRSRSRRLPRAKDSGSGYLAARRQGATPRDRALAAARVMPWPPSPRACAWPACRACGPSSASSPPAPSSPSVVWTPVALASAIGLTPAAAARGRHALGQRGGCCRAAGHQPSASRASGLAVRARTPGDAITFLKTLLVIGGAAAAGPAGGRSGRVGRRPSRSTVESGTRNRPGRFACSPACARQGRNPPPTEPQSARPSCCRAVQRHADKAVRPHRLRHGMAAGAVSQRMNRCVRISCDM
jgi:hypothetical protein